MKNLPTSSAMLVICRSWSRSSRHSFVPKLLALLICLGLLFAGFAFDRRNRFSSTTSRIIASFASRWLQRRSHNGSQRLGGTPRHNFGFGTATTSCPLACRLSRWWWWCGWCLSWWSSGAFAGWWGWVGSCGGRRHRNWTETKKKKSCSKKKLNSKQSQKETKIAFKQTQKKKIKDLRTVFRWWCNHPWWIWRSTASFTASKQSCKVACAQGFH